MDLDARVCDRARLARDARFDGRFFIAVLSTGIYCRPICPSPPPRPRNVRFYACAAAAQAEAAGAPAFGASLLAARSGDVPSGEVAAHLLRVAGLYLAGGDRARAEEIVQAHIATQPALMAIPAAERQAAHASH